MLFTLSDTSLLLVASPYAISAAGRSTQQDTGSGAVTKLQFRSKLCCIYCCCLNVILLADVTAFTVPTSLHINCTHGLLNNKTGGGKHVCIPLKLSGPLKWSGQIVAVQGQVGAYKAAGVCCQVC